MAFNLKYGGNSTLSYLLTLIKNAFVQKEAGKGLSTNDYTTDEKVKLAGLENYTLPTASSDTRGGIKVGAGLQMEGDVLSTTGGGVADSVAWSGVVGRPEASTNIDTDKADSTKFATPSAVATYVSTKMTSALIYKGSCAFADLPSLEAQNVGFVYNITDSFVTTANFVEGAGNSYGAGHNIAVAEVGEGSYKYDVLAGSIDLSSYVEGDELHEITNEELDTIWDGVFGTEE